MGVSQECYRGWDAWRVRRGDLELVLVPQVGGRVMSLVWRGRELFFVNPDLAGRVEDVDSTPDVGQRKRELGFLLWGGEKTWLAPQDRWRDGVPFLDLDSGPYGLEVGNDGTIVMTSRMCRETGVRVTRTLRFSPDCEGWTTSHRLLNTGAATVEWAPWGVSMVCRPGRVYLPTVATSPFPDGVKTFESEEGSVEARSRVVRRLGDLAMIDCTAAGSFKYGVDPGEGWMLGVVEVDGRGFVGIHKRVPSYSDQAYGHECLAEVYNSDRYPYFEVEVHGPLTRLEPGASCALEEATRVVGFDRWPSSEAEIRRVLD